MPKGGAPTFCSICGKKAMARLLCPNHYKQWQYRQNPQKYKNWESSRRIRQGDSIRESDHQRYMANPGPWKERSRLRKQRMAGVEGSHTPEEWHARLAEFAGLCLYCGDPATTRDHVIPITRGGTDNIDNIAPACVPCNSSKNNRMLGEWIARPDIVTRY